MRYTENMEKADCPFCDLKERILKENERAFVLLSNPRKTPGHFLVIPKRHVEKPWDIEVAELQDVFSLIGFIEQRLVEHFGGGCDMRQNYRPFLPQGRLKVDHIHYHVIPRTFKDTIYEKVEQFETGLFEDLSDEEHDRIARLLE